MKKVRKIAQLKITRTSIYNSTKFNLLTWTILLNRQVIYEWKAPALWCCDVRALATEWRHTRTDLLTGKMYWRTHGAHIRFLDRHVSIDFRKVADLWSHYKSVTKMKFGDNWSVQRNTRFYIIRSGRKF